MKAREGKPELTEKGKTVGGVRNTEVRVEAGRRCKGKACKGGKERIADGVGREGRD